LRHGPNKRSHGGRANGRRPFFNGRGSIVESSGADVKIKGTFAQVYDRYQALARDAMSAGDRIGAENFLQHADHYYRLIQAQSGNGHPQGHAPAPPFPLTNGEGGEAPFGDAGSDDDAGPGSDLPTA
jgi:hypothetical protein